MLDTCVLGGSLNHYGFIKGLRFHEGVEGNSSLVVQVSFVDLFSYMYLCYWCQLQRIAAGLHDDVVYNIAMSTSYLQMSK
jgi:hypothetical protein